MRNFVPLEVPGGIFRATWPVGVGRSTLAPAAASPNGQRQAEEQVISPPGKVWMRLHVNGNQDVSGCAARRGRLALAANANLLPVFYARGNLDLDRLRLARRTLDAQLHFAAADRGDEGNL